ncbi:MAG: substrate binding domain-containing protein [Myxococcota bacterium]
MIRARTVLKELDGAWGAVRQMQASPSGPLRISVPPTFLLQDFLAPFALAYPDVDVLVSTQTRQVDMITEGFDVALRIGKLRDDSVVARQLWADSHSVVASPRYLDEHGRPSSVADLQHHRCIGAGPQDGLGSRTWPLRNGGGHRVNVSVIVAEYVVGLQAAVSGVGLMLLPEPVTRPYRDRGLLEVVLEQEIGATFSGHVVYPNRRLLPQVRAFVDFIVEFYRDGSRPDVGAMLRLRPEPQRTR